MLAVAAVKYKFYKKRAGAVLVGTLRIDKGPNLSGYRDGLGSRNGLSEGQLLILVVSSGRHWLQIPNDSDP